ncbi:DNA sulfur modification protein DndD [Dryocola sp. BD586]|uniref:DNA sulfur modification protein DndD n=1 Tax=Dryocola sp. BD586 TaxID=3133271 RepID=UPI003F5032F2
MIFEEVNLYNFGIYQGHHQICLDSPSYEKPIILIGALNGAGKTTFLDALQLALYGKFAKCSNRGRLAYHTYLEKNINSFSQDRAAYISLRFRHGDSSNNPQVYEIKRSWIKESSKECKERITVSFNGKNDQLLSDHWDDFVNEFIPQSISELFFFDGEKIENLADPKRSAELLKTGIEALLGLEMLSKLSSDLKVLKRKKQENQLKKIDFEEIEMLKKELTILNQEKNNLKEALQQKYVQEHEETELLENVRQKLLTSGADKLSLKERYEHDKKINLQKQFEVTHELQKLVSSALPLALIPELLASTSNQLHIEKNAQIFKSANKLLEQQKNEILNILASEFGTKKSLSSIKKKIEKLEIEKEDKYKTDCYINIDPVYFDGLNEKLSCEKNNAKQLVQTKHQLKDELIFIESNINTIPSFDAVKDLLSNSAVRESNLDKTRNDINNLNKEIVELDDKIKTLENKYNSVLLRNNSVHFEQKRQNQIISHIDVLNDIVNSFNEELVKENISKLERNIKSKFDLLKRKDSLISKLNIDPIDYTITLFTTNRDTITPDRLSAGERQLFAIAILWGLADSSGKELPTIIDTPMGRLDGQHRNRLIEKYFPNAASQVILLSTDEEIYGKYYKDIRPYLAQEYSISYDEFRKTSYFEKGYLEVAR